MHSQPPPPVMLNYPPLQQADRRASSSNFEYAGRRSVSAQIPRQMPQASEVQRPDYMQRWDALLYVSPLGACSLLQLATVHADLAYITKPAL